jgi:flagellar assembly protein FliH
VAPAPPPPGPVSVHPSVASFPPEARNHDAIAARYRAAIDALRLESQRLAEQARADAVEIAFQVARKLLEAELSANPERLFGLVRQAIQKLGDARRVTLRVCQADLNALKSEHGQAELAHTGVASVEIVADPKLGPGDCVIESPVGAVDGRLSVRLAEVRRSVAEALEEEAA